MYFEDLNDIFIQIEYDGYIHCLTGTSTALGAQIAITLISNQFFIYLVNLLLYTVFEANPTSLKRMFEITNINNNNHES